MGGDEIVPLPSFRCPCRRTGPRRDAWLRLLEDLVGTSGYEVTPTVVVQSNELGVLKQFALVAVFVLYLYWQFFIGKGYLTVAPIVGVSRMQMQHPIKGHCNPLVSDCIADYRGFENLPYCAQAPEPANDWRGLRETCEYYDAFDLEFGEIQANKFMIPTRRTLVTQELTCDTRRGPCQQKYRVKDRETIFVADIESFTLLIDHSFICEELGIDRRAWSMQGFYAPCLREGGSSRECGRRQPINVAAGLEGQRADKADEEAMLRSWWVEGEAPARPPFYKIHGGDIIRIGDLLDSLGIKLDAPLEGNSTLRQAGLVLIVEISYYNYKTGTRPNALPPVYEYNFLLVPTSEYKVHGVVTPNILKILQTGLSEGQRLVDDRHGIYITVVQRGTLGKFSFHAVTMMLVESSILLGLVKWFVHMVALNWSHGAEGDRFEAELQKEVPLKAGAGESKVAQPLLAEVDMEMIGPQSGQRQSSPRALVANYQPVTSEPADVSPA